MTIAQVLARAAQLVERGRYERIEGMPMARALYEATSYRYSAYLEAYDTMSSFLGVWLLTDWGYPPKRTCAETACWLSSAAEYAKVLGK